MNAGREQHTPLPVRKLDGTMSSPLLTGEQRAALDAALAAKAAGAWRGRGSRGEMITM